MKNNQKKIRYAVVGLGHIAQVAVLPAFKKAKNSELVAFVSGDKTKQKKIPPRYGVTKVYDYEDYEACLQSGDIDAVYIALPNTMHEEYCEKAAEAGIHILCEKPLSVFEEESLRIEEAVKKAKIKMMVAYRLHFDPLNLKAIEIANSGKIGNPCYFTSEFGYQLKEDNIRADPKEGGSPLHDIGIYCINAARYIFQDEPSEVFAMASSPEPTPKRIHQTVTATLRFPRDRLANFVCSFGSAPISNFRVVGTKGDLFIKNVYEYVEERVEEVTVGGKTKSSKSKAPDQFAAEIEYFSDCILNNKKPEPSAEHGRVDVRIIEALNESIKTGQCVSLKDDFDHSMPYPNARIKIKKGAHREPKLVRVASASR